MNFRQIQYFQMLAKELHYKVASSKLYIVQPALTKQIQELERELQVKLFDRNKRGVKLTAAGLYLQSEVEHLLQHIEQIKKNVRAINVGSKGKLTIGYVGSCIHTFFPALLNELHTLYPEIQTHLLEMTTSLQLESVKSGELDIAFLRNPPFEKELHRMIVFRETFSLVVPKKHFLSDKKFKHLSQVRNENFILPTKTDGENYSLLQLQICNNAGFEPIITHETVHGHTVLKMVENNLGVSLLPTSFRDITTAHVTFIELKRIKERAEITAIWNKRNFNPSLKKFTECLRVF